MTIDQHEHLAMEFRFDPATFALDGFIPAAVAQFEKQLRARVDEYLHGKRDD